MIQRESVPVAEATAAQLREFAITVLGIEVGRTDTAAMLRAKIASAGFDRDSITVAVPTPTDAHGAQRAAVKALAPEGDGADEWVTVILEKTEDSGGDQPQWVSVNGRGLWIERGKPQPIRRQYERALHSAKLTVYDQADAHSPLVPRQVQRIPYRVVG